MNPEQQARLLEETRETAARLNKLNTFMATDAFPKLQREDKDLLYRQQRVMSKYVQILGKRLERAGQQFTHAEQPDQAGMLLPTTQAVLRSAIARLETIRETHGHQIDLDRDIEIYRSVLP